jgi:hypothetical protein
MPVVHAVRLSLRHDVIVRGKRVFINLGDWFFSNSRDEFYPSANVATTVKYYRAFQIAATVKPTSTTFV